MISYIWYENLFTESPTKGTVTVMNNDCTVFGKNLIKFRKANSMTQEQLARKMNVSPQAVSKWEKNSYPDAQLLPLLAQTLNTSLDVLFGLKEESEIDT